jgi:hypothetical protein
MKELRKSYTHKIWCAESVVNAEFLPTLLLSGNMDTKRRTLVKAVIYRIWILTTTYIMFLVTGKSFSDAFLPTIAINSFWMIGYILYERIWQKIKWGKH